MLYNKLNIEINSNNGVISKIDSKKWSEELVKNKEMQKIVIN